MSRLRLSIKGEPGAITLSSFVGILTRASLILGDLDSAISENPKGSLEWYVADLRVGSLEAIIESRSVVPEIDGVRLGVMVNENFVGGLEAIQNDDMPPYFSDLDLGRVKAIAGLLRKTDSDGLDAAHLNGGLVAVRTATLSQDAGKRVTAILAPKSKAIGSVVGKLEVISVHGPPRFNVYDVLTKKAVACRFDPEKLDDVTAALGHRVSVTGIVNRNAHGDPVKVEKPELRVLGSDNEPPTVRDLIGLAPDITGGLTSQEYVRKLRNG